MNGNGMLCCATTWCPPADRNSLAGAELRAVMLPLGRHIRLRVGALFGCLVLSTSVCLRTRLIGASLVLSMLVACHVIGTLFWECHVPHSLADSISA